MESVILQDSVRTDMVAHAHAEAPNECCGLLIGVSGLIDACVRARNLRASRTRYLLDPADHIAANRRLRGTGRMVLGCYHSHPQSPPIPSERDCREALYEEFLWLIVSLTAPEASQVAAFRIRGGSFTPVEILRSG